MLEFGKDHSEDQQRTLGQQLIEGRDRGQDHAVIENADHRNTKQRTDNAALATIHGAAAKEGSRDRFQLKPLRAGNRLPRSGSGRQQDATDTGNRTTHHERANAIAVEIDTGKPRHDRIAPDGIEIPSDNGFRKEDVKDDRRDDQHPDRAAECP